MTSRSQSIRRTLLIIRTLITIQHPLLREIQLLVPKQPAVVELDALVIQDRADRLHGVLEVREEGAGSAAAEACPECDGEAGVGAFAERGGG